MNEEKIFNDYTQYVRNNLDILTSTIFSTVDPLLKKNQPIIDSLNKKDYYKLLGTNATLASMKEAMQSDFRRLIGEQYGENYNDVMHSRDRDKLYFALQHIKMLKETQKSVFIKPRPTMLSRVFTLKRTPPTISVNPIQSTTTDLTVSAELIDLEEKIDEQLRFYPDRYENYVGGKRRNTKRRKRTRKHN